MLALKATVSAAAGLRALRSANPELFGVVSDSITAVREDPGGRDRGHTFRLADGRTARLATYYDVVAQRDLVLVWLIEERDELGTLDVIAVEHTG